ncbi:MAG: DUF721 domain-containing protein [Acidobacteria bacterium]|nr:DUF721 domain-containing protein [Acidobacteriota bacterium]
MESMRDLLRGELAHSLQSLPPLERLAMAWPVAAGSSIAARSAVSALDKGVCTIQVETPQWLAQLRPMEERLRIMLTDVAKVPLTALHFEQKP